LAEGSVRPSHESLQEKLLVSGYEVLHRAIDNDSLQNEHEIVHTKLWIPIVTVILRPAPCAELNVLPLMITFENLKRAISTTGNV
jgi:hypothetical protein